MRIPPFRLERFFAEHEFSVKHLLCASDCESMSVGELLAFEPSAETALRELWLGYTESTGHPELRREICRLYQGIGPEEVLVHAGAEEAIFNFMHVFLRPGDHVVVQSPAYQSLSQIAQHLGCRVTPWNLRERNGWELDVDELERLLEPGTRLVVVNQPHNPTGHLMQFNQFSRIINLLDRRGIFLFCDEVYRGLEYDEGSRLPAACELYSRAVSLGVVSKSLGLAGLRIGWIATRDQAVRHAMTEFKDYTSICCSAPSELLATLALRHRDRIWSRNRNLTLGNLALLESFFAGRSDIRFLRPAAGCIGFPRVLGDENSESYCSNLLEKRGVLLAPGKLFGSPGHFRIGFGRKAFAEGLEAWSFA